MENSTGIKWNMRLRTINEGSVITLGVQLLRNGQRVIKENRNLSICWVFLTSKSIYVGSRSENAPR